MIEIKNLSYTYSEGERPALKDVNLQIKEGEFILITGESGSGKSTFLYILNGLIPHVFGGDLRGSVFVNRLNPKDHSIRELSQFVGTVFQNPDSQIFMLRVEDDVAFGCENLLLPKDEIIRRRDLALKDLGLWNLRKRETFTLSGGEKQRLAIAGIYAMGPKILLFDEPTADLDEEGRSSFLQILRGLKRRYYTIIVVEHQYEDFLPLADRVLKLEKGQITIGYDQFPSQLNPVRKDGASNPALSKEIALSIYTSPPQGAGLSNGVNLKKRKNPHQSMSLCIKIEDLWFSYGDLPCLKGIDLRIKKGESVALIGKNGSGKTTLFKAILGLLKPQKGTILIDGLLNPGLHDLIGKVGFLFQNPDEQLFTSSAEEEVGFGPKNLGKNIDINECLKLFELEKYKGRHPQTFSRGERQRLALASVLSMQPEIILLDEPTTGLDIKSWSNLMAITYNLTLYEKTIIFSTHNRKALEEFADRVIHLEEGKIAQDEVLR